MSWLLPVLLGVPLAGAVLLGSLPGLDDRETAALAVAASGGALGLAGVAALGFHPDRGSPSYALDLAWVPTLGVRFAVGVDGLSLPLVVLTALLVLLCCLHVVRHPPEGATPRLLLALVLLLEVGMLGTFLALDLVLFFVFFEVVLVPMFFLVAGWGGERRRHASVKFLLYTLLGSALMLVGFLVIGAARAGDRPFDMVALGAAHGVGLSRTTQDLAITALVLGFAVKAPIWPLHTWLPDAHTEAPTVGSVLLAGVLLKLGTYGLVRIAVGFLPLGARDAAPLLAVLGTVAVVYAALCCLAQTVSARGDLKRLIAYSSVGHMGFVVLGVATLSPTGLDAALIGNVAHGVVTGLLFFLAGAVKERFGTTSLVSVGGGLLGKAPILGGLLVFACVASLGLPGLAGFWGEVLALVGAADPGAGLSHGFYRTLLVLAAVGTVLTAGYFLKLLATTAFGPVAEHWRGAAMLDLSVAELAAWSPLVVLTVAIGVYPRLVLGVTHPAVVALLGVTP